MRRNIVLLAIVILVSGAVLFFIFRPKPEKKNEGGGETISIQVTPEKTESLVSGFNLNAGERIEIEVDAYEGFLVDGKYQTKVVPPYSKEAWIQFKDPNGKLYRLADRITGHRAEFSGQYTLSVELPPNLRVWSGRNLEAKTLSEFKPGPIKIYIRKLEEEGNFHPNALIAKEVSDQIVGGEIFGGVGESFDKSNEVISTAFSGKDGKPDPVEEKVISNPQDPVEEEMKKGVRSLRKVWDEWFNDPLLNPPK